MPCEAALAKPDPGAQPNHRARAVSCDWPSVADQATYPSGRIRMVSISSSVLALTGSTLSLQPPIDLGVSSKESNRPRPECINRLTLFAYFPMKEDLVLQRFADHEDEAARTVRARRTGQPPLDALREAMLDALRRRDPSTGLNDHPEIMAFLRTNHGRAMNPAQINELSNLHSNDGDRDGGGQSFSSILADMPQCDKSDRLLGTISFEVFARLP
jgi:hypothetical protein